MSESPGPGAGGREVAVRLFATEYDDADISYTETDEDRAPNYVLTPSGARINRLFVVGVLTEVEPVSEDVLRARVVDPTGAFVLYAGQYQPDERAFLDRVEPPTFLAVTGKARTFQPEDGDVVYTSVRPESLNEVDEATRDRWTIQAAEQTIDRVATMASARRLDARGDNLREILRANGVPEGLASGIPRALAEYETGGAYLRALFDVSRQAGAVVAGQRDEVASMMIDPDDPSEADLGPLPTRELAVEETDETDGDRPVDTTEESTDSTGDRSEVDAVAKETQPATDESDEDETDSDSTEAAESIESADTDTAIETSGAGESSPAPETGEEFDGEFELEDDEREALESEFGAEFQSGNEVDEPGAADIETPTEADQADTEEPAESTTEETDGDQSDLEELVLSVMTELDDGNGADREAVIETAIERSEEDRSAIEAAIQSALMDGLCYEPDDASLQAI